jgi:hypothetical protein
MMLSVLGVQSALLAVMATCRKRTAVLKTLTVQSRGSAPVRMFSRAISARAQNATTMERMIAAKTATLIRGFVQTTAFDQAVLAVVARIRSQCLKNRGIR